MPRSPKKNQCQHCIHATICLLACPPALDSSLNAFCFAAKILKKGEHLCYQGQHSENLYILRTGLLKGYLTKANGEECIMGFYLPPDLFGWECVDEIQPSISILALETSNICVIPSQKLVDLSYETPSLASQLIRMVGRRIQQDNVALLRTTALQRVATFLLQLQTRYQQIGFSPNCFHLAMTHQDIANYLRITPSTISRIFHELQEKNTIKINKHLIYLLDRPSLSDIAEIDQPEI